MRELLEQLETAADEPTAALAYLASRSVAFGPDELNAARRRGLLVLAAGGDPHRELDPRGPAVRSVAHDLDAPGRRDELAAALAALRAEASALPRIRAALDVLLADEDLAWRWLACALLADELAAADDD